MTQSIFTRFGMTVLALTACTSSAVMAAEDMPNCPIMGEPINFAVSTPTDDGPVYFCCKGCIKKYNADAATYAKDVAAQRKALAARPKVQVKCPLSGEPADKKIFVMHEGAKIIFCCKGCAGKFEKEPAKYQAALNNSYSFQTKCPVMDEEIDPQSFTTLPSGETIYYCCDGCEKKVFAEPAKYAAVLAKQGIRIPAAKIKRASGDDDHDHKHGGGHDHGH